MRDLTANYASHSRQTIRNTGKYVSSTPTGVKYVMDMTMRNYCCDTSYLIVNLWPQTMVMELISQIYVFVVKESPKYVRNGYTA